MHAHDLEGAPPPNSARELEGAQALGRCLSADAATAYAAGHLTPDELSVVGAHIDGCVSCRKLLSHAAELLTPVPSSSRTDDREPFRLGDRLAPGDVVGRYVVDAQ